MSKIRDFAALAQQWRDLEAAGIPLEPFENRVGIDARSPGRVLTIRTGSHHGRSEIRELWDGRFGYILSVFVRRDLPGKTRIRDSWVSPPWDDPTIEWLEDPKDVRTTSRMVHPPRRRHQNSSRASRFSIIASIVCSLVETFARACFWVLGVFALLTCTKITIRFQSRSPYGTNGVGKHSEKFANANESVPRSCQGNLQAHDAPFVLLSRHHRSKTLIVAPAPTQD